ncbi:MAG: SDR family oxidoreductase [Streptomycetaceae bacterium]|nr:SDR family oxidoreductase [Streptomycetaceae bacterium]NUS55146.1 SDR family oxidoreductase [Streptomycetaceae bacterium]
MRGLGGKVAVVTGGARGIGAATAVRLAEENVAVAIGDLHGEEAEALAGKIRADGGKAVALRMNIRDEESVDALVAAAVDAFGGLDLLVNNAGGSLGHDRNVAENDDRLWSSTWDLNLMGTVRVTRAALPHLRARGGGAIVNIASGSGTLATPGLAAYGTSKAAVIQLTRNVVAAYSHEGIRCNAICPGMIITPGASSAMPADVIARIADRIPMGRTGTPEDIAGLVTYLLSADAAYVNGQVIHCDGGARDVGPSGPARGTTA